MKTILIRTTTLPILICFFSVLACNGAAAQDLGELQLTDFTAQSRNGDVGLSWKTRSEQDVREFDVQYSRDGKYYRDLGFIPARNSINGEIYEIEYPVLYNDSAFYRLKIVDKDGRFLFTVPLLYHVNNISAFFVNPSVIDNSVMNIFLHDPFNSLEIVSTSGEVMLKQNLSGETGRITIPLATTLSAGVYVVQLKNPDKTITQKIVIN